MFKRVFLATLVVCVVGFSLSYNWILDKIYAPQGDYVFLRSHCVNGRCGPSKEYPCKCQYQFMHVPLRVIAQKEEWFFVEDWSAIRSWVHRSLLSKRCRYALTLMPKTNVYKANNSHAEIKAVLEEHIVVHLLRVQGEWARVRLQAPYNKCEGWIEVKNIWGV